MIQYDFLISWQRLIFWATLKQKQLPKNVHLLVRGWVYSYPSHAVKKFLKSHLS